MRLRFLSHSGEEAGGFVVRFQDKKIQYALSYCSNEWKNVPDRCGEDQITWTFQRTNKGLLVKCGRRGTVVLEHFDLRDNLSKTCTRVLKTPAAVYWGRTIHRVQVVDADKNDNAAVTWAVSKFFVLN